MVASTKIVFADSPKGVFACSRASRTHQMVCKKRYFACGCLCRLHAKIKIQKNKKQKITKP